MLPSNIRCMAAYYPLVPHLSLQLDTAATIVDISAPILAALDAVAHVLAAAWAQASPVQASSSQQTATPSNAAPHSQQKSAMDTSESMLFQRGCSNSKVRDAAESPGRLPLQQVEMGGSNSRSSESASASLMDRRVPGRMPIQQLQGLHKMLAGLAGAAGAGSIQDDLHSGMFGLAPSHQLLPGADPS